MSHAFSAELQDRIAWRTSRLPGRTACDFAVGEVVRCPGIKTLSRGAKVACGAPMGTVKPGTRVIVRARRDRPPQGATLGKDVTCPDCHTALEEFVLAADAPRLEATG